ncbi:hypothetical protein ACFL2B_01810 [Patescibacteria group bacterium]
MSFLLGIGILISVLACLSAVGGAVCFVTWFVNDKKARKKREDKADFEMKDLMVALFIITGILIAIAAVIFLFFWLDIQPPDLKGLHGEVSGAADQLEDKIRGGDKSVREKMDDMRKGAVKETPTPEPGPTEIPTVTPGGPKMPTIIKVKKKTK